MIRVGIIGLGFMGRTHYGVYEKLAARGEAQVVAISDADPKRAAGDLSGGWGNLATGGANQLPMDRIKGTTDYRQMLAMPDVDVVDVCIPTTEHVPVVTAALESGKHVLCEKPMARTAADARAIADAAANAARRGVLFMPAMCMRFWSEWEWLKHAVAEGRYGRVLSASFRRLGTIPAGWYRNGALSGGALLDLHIHDTDFVYHLFGKPRAVFSQGYTGKSAEIDYVLTQYLFDGGQGQPGTPEASPAGPAVSAEGSWTMAEGFGFRMQFTVTFERATADFDLFRKDATLVLSGEGKSGPVEHAKHDGYLGEISYFLECVKTRTAPERVTAEDGVMGLTIAEAEKRSIQSGRIETV